MGQEQDHDFERLYQEEWSWRQEQLADAEDNQRPVAAYLPDVSEEAQQERLGRWQETLRHLERIPREGLAAHNQVSYDVYRWQLESLVAQQRFRQYQLPVNSDTTFWTNLAYTARRTFRSPEDYHGWLSQLEEVPRYFRQQQEQMRAGMARGFTPPRVTLQGRELSLTSVTGVPARETVLFSPFNQLPTPLQEGEHADLARRAERLIEERVQPAYAEQLAFMTDEYLPGARSSLAAKELPDGEEYYRSLIREYTTLDLSPGEVHEIGLAEMEKLEGQMAEVMAEVSFRGSLREFLASLRQDRRFYAASPEQLLSRAAWICKVFDGKAERYFGRIPRRPFTIEPVPDDMAPFYTAGRGGPGIYLVNTYDLPNRPLYNLPALTLHEAAPGHAFQMALALEGRELPEFRRHGYISAFGEGWALYCELLGEEMGMYQSPYERFGMLGYQAWRAARLVIDTGVHAFGWTREQAMDYLRDHATLPEHEVETEVDRYIAWPAQALSYYLGELTLVRGRRRAEQRLGSSFQLANFHDFVLKLGCVPLAVLDQQIDDFADSGGSSPYHPERG